MRKCMKRKWVLSILVCLAVVMVFTGCKSKTNDAQTLEELRNSVDLNQVVAEYENTTLSYEEFIVQLELQEIFRPGIAAVILKDKENIMPEYAKQAVIMKHLHDKAVAEGVKVDEEQVEMDLSYFTMQNADMSQEDLDKIKEFIAFDSVLTQSLMSQINDEEVKEYYDENQSFFTRASVRHILVAIDEERTDEEAKALADDLTARIRQGEDMADLATEFTDDEGSQASGGLYEDQLVMGWVDEFRDAALTSELNVVTDPVKTEYGYHVMRVEDRNVAPLDDESKEMIKGALVQDVYGEYMTTAMEKVTVSL